MRVEFETTIEEAVDVQMRAARRTSAYRRQRRRNGWAIGVAFALGVAEMTLRQAPSHVTNIQWALVASIALVSGIAARFVYGFFHDDYVRRYARRVVVEQYGGTGPFWTEVETRPEGLRANSTSMQVMFPWAKFAGLDAADGNVEVRFNPGLVVVRARAFATAGDRERFVAEIRSAAGVLGT